MASVRQIPGRKVWIACFTGEDGRRHQRSTGTRNRKDAMKIAEEWEAVARGKRTFAQVQRVTADLFKAIAGQDFPAYTLRTYAKRYLDHKVPTVTPGTAVKYKEAIRSLLDGVGKKADSPFAVITTEDLQTWRMKELERIRPSTLGVYEKLTRGMFRTAQAEGLRTDNPAALLKALPKQEAVRNAFSPEQVRDLLRVADEEWRSLILFAVYTGQRAGDLCALTWRNIDTVGGWIQVTTQKTGRKTHIPIAAPLLQHIAALPIPKDSNAPLHPRAAAMTRQRFSQLFADLLRVAGLRGPEATGGTGTRASKRTRNEYSFHSFRHTAVSFMKSAGVGESMVMEIIGHDSEAVSRGYTHLDLEAKRAALATMPDVTGEGAR
jgi:integrase